MRDYKKTILDLRNFNANYEANKLTNDAADAIEELLAKVPQWISVEERLPEFGERVLVCGRIDDFGDEPEYGIDIAYRYHAGVEHIDFYWDSTFDVTHWMPLPEPPSGFKEVQDD